jgi:hypothetical protein
MLHTGIKFLKGILQDSNQIPPGYSVTVTPLCWIGTHRLHRTAASRGCSVDVLLQRRPQANSSVHLVSHAERVYSPERGVPTVQTASARFLLIILFVCLRTTKLSWFYVIICYQWTVFAGQRHARSFGSHRHARTAVLSADEIGKESAA